MNILLSRRMAVVLLAGCGVAMEAQAGSPACVNMAFSTSNEVGMGNDVYVVGSHPDIGAWSPTGAVKLFWTPDNIWTGHIAIQAGETFEYKFIARATVTNLYCNPGNVTWLSPGNLTGSVPAQPSAPYAGKTVYYHSGWTNASLVYRVGTNWFDAAMNRVGEGRQAGEYLYQVAGIGEEAEGIEFIPHGHWNGAEYWDHAPYGGYGGSNYYTELDVLFLQDGNVFNYWPPASVSVSRIVVTNVGSSWAPTIPSRDIRIYLPRGYDQNKTWKKYPVLYMHDGQNDFYPGGSYGSWDADLSANREISQGRMRETIIVGVDNTDERLREYCPPGDNGGFGPGTGDQYANFLVHNVRPTVDYHYRTLSDPENTLTMGSSFGGLISAYLGFKTNVFGKIAPMSPSFWAGENFVNSLTNTHALGLRIYLDCGTDEDTAGDPEMWNGVWDMNNLLMGDGYAINGDLWTRIGCGHIHNEWAWAQRLPDAYRFLLSLWDEPNRLAHEAYPPIIADAGLEASGHDFTVALGTLKGWAYRLQSTPGLVDPAWTNASSPLLELMPWSQRTLMDTNASVERRFYRVVAE